MSQKSYSNKVATLYLIPTPIGNLEDITIRAVNILKEVDVVFCEDTRVTSLLLKHLDIHKKMVPNHEFNERQNQEKLINYLSKGLNVGLVSDRGTPVISDPGYEMAKIAIENNYNVVALPGPTALIPALISSGLAPSPFTFYGFLNSKEGKRKKELEELKSHKETMIFYEAPHRIEDTLKNILEVLGNRSIAISREITKKYEEIFRGSVEDVIKEINNIKGEIVIVVDGNKEEINFDNIPVIEHINSYIKQGLSSKDAIKKVSEDRHVKKGDIYNEYHKGE